MYHRIITVVSFAVAFTALSAASVEARPTCGEGGDRCRPAAGTVFSGTAAGDEPIAALDGRTLAQYLADHMAGDRRTAGRADASSQKTGCDPGDRHLRSRT